MSSDLKSDSISFLNKGKNNVSTTDTELHLDLFADPSKLKPVSKIVKMNKIDENSDDSHIVNKTMYSSDSDSDSDSSDSSKKSSKKSYRRSSKKSSSSSRSSSSSSRSSSSRKSSKVRSESHKKLDDYVNSYNNIKTDSKPTESKYTENVTSQQQVQPPKPGEPGAMPYIPVYKTEREIRFRKMELLCILNNIKKTRDLSKSYTIASELQDLEDEVRFHSEQEKKVVSVGFAKDGLLKMCQLLEIANGTFDPFGIQLKGWHGQMSSNIENYDGVFGELYEKYKNYVGRVEPEYKLMYMIFGSAASFHYSKQFVEQYGLEKLVEKNPELLQKIQANIASTMEKNIGKKDESKEKKDAMPTMTQQQMYQQMVKEKEELEKKLKDQQNQMAQNQKPPVNNTINNTINKMMNVQQTGLPNNLGSSGVEIKKPNSLNDLLSRVKATNTNASIPLVDTQTSASSRIKVINTVDSESISDSENVQSISKLRLSRRQRPQVNGV
jgi:hypothetical protein